MMRIVKRKGAEEREEKIINLVAVAFVFDVEVVVVDFVAFYWEERTCKMIHYSFMAY